MSEPMGQLTVVGEQDGASGEGIEAPYRHYARLWRNELHDSGSAVGIARGGDDPCGLVQEDVGEGLRGHPLPVDLDGVAGADERVQLTWHTVDGHSAGLDQLVGTAARGDAVS